MRRLTPFIVVLVLLAPLTAVTPVAGAPAGAIGSGTASGSVQELVTITVSTETADGTAVGNVDLTVNWQNGSTTATTRSNGQALVDVPRGADISIETDHPDYVRNFPRRAVNITAEDTIEVPMYQRSQAVITVQDSDSKVANAQVELSKRGDSRTAAQGTTGQNGVFQTGAMEAGQYSVTISKSGYYTEVGSISLKGVSGGTYTIEEGTATVTFKVTDDHFAPPRPLQAPITVESNGQEIATVTTASNNGERGVTLDVNTQYSVTVERDGYRSVSDTFTLGESDRRIQYNITRTPELVLTADNTRVLTGQNVRLEVVDEYDQAVPDAAIRFDGQRVASTDGNGVARVSLDSLGMVNVTARKDGVTSEPISIEAVEAAAMTTTTMTTTTTTTAAPTTTTTTTTPDEGIAGDFPLPGFTPALAVIGILVGLLALRRRN